MGNIAAGNYAIGTDDAYQGYPSPTGTHPQSTGDLRSLEWLRTFYIASRPGTVTNFGAVWMGHSQRLKLLKNKLIIGTWIVHGL